MNTFKASRNLSIYQSTDSKLSRQEILDLILRETRQKYPHLNVRFFPDRYMQAMIRIKSTNKSLIQETPQVFIDILRAEKFFPESFTHRLPECDGNLDAQQYVLINEELQQIGYRFVMKATFGPTFISFWFRDESEESRLDLPIFYALEILNKLHDRFNQLDAKKEAKEPAEGTTTEDTQAVKTG